MKDVAQAAQLMSTGNKRLCTGSVNSDPTENHFCGAALKSPLQNPALRYVNRYLTLGWKHEPR
jgi:hypothetical protein